MVSGDIEMLLASMAVIYGQPLDYNYHPPTYVDNASPTDLTNSLQTISSGGNTSFQPYTSSELSTPTVEFEKQFYSYSAPEETLQDNGELEKALASLNKKLRVIFIRTPENYGLEQAAMELLKSTAENHMAIYVFAKQTDVADLAQKLQSQKIQNEIKPEVHFIKYRTDEDAAYAQQVIRDQFNSLPGNIRRTDNVETSTELSSRYKFDSNNSTEQPMQPKTSFKRKYLASRRRIQQ
ncbi:uncharacterized protein [Musca autumnalis]|uniref:uncharacterized protein n=1 Tax=Musca autumnalis TaxID=221902 RepID=UPI003CE7049A